MENDDSNSEIPLSWEDESDAAKKLLEKQLKQAELKQLLKKQQEASDDAKMNGAATDVAQSQQEIIMPAAGMIKILKRPESGSNLNKTVANPNSKPSEKYLQREELKRDNISPQNGGAASTDDAALAAAATKTLQDRVTAYAEARQRIFGVIDPVVHEELPLQPKLAQRPAVDNETPSQKP